jgi:hypothetical protein
LIFLGSAFEFVDLLDFEQLDLQHCFGQVDFVLVFFIVLVVSEKATAFSLLLLISTGLNANAKKAKRLMDNIIFFIF